MGHRRYVHHGDLRAGAAGGSCRGQEPAGGGPGVRAGAEDGMRENSLPPGYRREKPVRRPRLVDWQGVIDAILQEDKQRPKKQRHSAKRIFERVKAEYSFPDLVGYNNFLWPFCR